MGLLGLEKIWRNSVQLIRFSKYNISLFYALTQALGKTSLIGQLSFSPKKFGNFLLEKILN